MSRSKRNSLENTWLSDGAVEHNQLEWRSKRLSLSTNAIVDNPYISLKFSQPIAATDQDLVSFYLHLSEQDRKFYLK